jgi:heptaprenyl diphosphate synthase
MFLAAALVAGLVERAIPFDFAVPGVKLGLSNVVILTALYIFSFSKSLTLVVAKCLTLMLVTGNVPALMYSLGGSLLSFLAMWLVIRLSDGGRRVSTIGVSVVGAVCHNIGQIAVAMFILGTVNVAAYLPLLIISGVITGVLVGVAVKFALPVVKKAIGSAQK